MIRQNDNGNKRKMTREEKNKLASRILAGILALLMIGGAAYYAIYLMAMSAKAQDSNTAANGTETVIMDTSSLSDSGDVPVRVGLSYGDGVTVGFEVSSVNGFTLGITDGETGAFEEIWNLSTAKVSVTADGNLAKSNMTYSHATDSSSARVGGYHVQIDCDHLNETEFVSYFRGAEQTLAGIGLEAIPAYVYTGYTIRAGVFTTRNSAEQNREIVQQLFPDATVYVTGASSASVSVIDPETDEILFEYDCGHESELGLRGNRDSDGNTYIKTPAANVYDGIFLFMRSSGNAGDGVSLINILPLEAYIAGVLPYETSNTWPLETLKAFAITVRSYTLTHMARHTASGFDMCNNAHCQVYKGAGRINERVYRAVSETKGQVMTYDGKIVTAYYSSSMGGVTVSAQEAWGGAEDIPYLQATETPWEDYMNHNNGFWITEITPEDLATRLRQAGYTKLQGAIASVSIEALARNSTYIKSLVVTDIYGNTERITTTEGVRTSLTPYVKSANFVIGKGSVEYTENVVSASSSGSNTESGTASTVRDYTTDGDYDKDYGYINLYDYHVITAEEEYTTDIDFSVTIRTADGDTTYERSDVFVLSAENAPAFTGEEAVYPWDRETTSSDTHVTETLPDKSTSTLLYKVAYAENSDNFIIVGKGWGHGVGMSQYGALDLAELGYDAVAILNAYFTGVEVLSYRQVAEYRQ